MDDRRIPFEPSSLELSEPKFETINGQEIPRGTLADFALAVYKKPLEEIKPWPQPAGGLNLAYQKLVTAAGKQYRLVWRGRGVMWLAAEDGTPYRTRMRVAAAGYELSLRVGAFFDEGRY